MGPDHFWEKNRHSWSTVTSSATRRSLSKVPETLTADVNTEITLKCTLHDQSRTGPGTNTNTALATPNQSKHIPSTEHSRARRRKNVSTF